MNPLDPIGDRRCPQCQSVKKDAQDECWYCNPDHYRNDLDAKLAEAIQKYGPELEKAMAELRDRGPELVAGARTFSIPTPAGPLKVVTDPTMEPGTFELRDVPIAVSRTRTDKLPENSSGATHIEQIEALCLRIGAMQSTNLIGDAAQLVKYCRELLKENKRLHAFRAAVVQCAKDHGHAGAVYEQRGNDAGAAQLRAVQNLLWSLVYDSKGATVLPWDPDDKP